MYPEMRRKKQALSPAACDAILQAGTSGVLALAGADGQPYAVPLSYVYHEGKVYFHCARAGHKLDLLDQNPKASFCVIGQDQVVPEKYTTYYRSVILFGTVRRLTAGEEKRAAILALARRYSPDEPAEGVEAEIARYWDALCMLELTPATSAARSASSWSGRQAGCKIPTQNSPAGALRAYRRDCSFRLLVSSCQLLAWAAMRREI